MLKTIPKSNVSKRAFQVHKSWTVTQDDYAVITAEEESRGSFDSGSASNVTVNGSTIYTSPLYTSLKSKYYSNIGNTFTLIGKVKNIGNISEERSLGSSAQIVKIPQSVFGEKIKAGSVTLVDNDNEITFSDNSTGGLTSSNPLYTLVLLDFEQEIITIKDADNEEFTGTISSFDVETGLSTLTFNGDTDIVTIVLIDLLSGTLQTSVPLDFDGLSIDEIKYGNIFYSEGLIVLTNATSFTNYTLDFKSTKTIYETEVLVTANAGEFNTSQNPSAVSVNISGSYDFEITKINNVIPGGTKKITEVIDINKKSAYTSSYDGSTTGSWNDYDTHRQTDPTGSYLTPYITTVGLYNDNNEMVAVAKLPTPIKNLPDYDMSIIIRFDT